MRLTQDEYLMSLAVVAAQRTTCIRRAVGCVLADSKGKVLSIGYNGVARGMPHCNEGHYCQGHDSDTGKDLCEAVHAEQNALLQCKDVEAIAVAYVTLSPCISCLKLLINTGCKRIVIATEWDDPRPKQLWHKLKRKWEVITC